MPSFLAAVPTWAWIVIAILALYGLYRWYKYKKANAYAPNIVRGIDKVITSLRDNPEGNGH